MTFETQSESAPASRRDPFKKVNGARRGSTDRKKNQMSLHDVGFRDLWEWGVPGHLLARPRIVGGKSRSQTVSLNGRRIHKFGKKMLSI